MGCYANCNGTLAIAAAAVAPLWAALEAAARTTPPMVDISAAASADPDDGLAGKIGAVIAEQIGQDCAGYGYQADELDGVVDLSIWGDGKILGAKRVLRIVAEHGVTGIIECRGEDYSLWQWRLADGAVHDEDGRIVYDGEVDTDGFIAQLQGPGDSSFDRVAVLPSESSAWAQIATWCRADYRDYRDEVPVSAVQIDDDTDDDTVIARWTTLLGGVKYRIMRVGAHAASGT